MYVNRNFNCGVRNTCLLVCLSRKLVSEDDGTNSQYAQSFGCVKVNLIKYLKSIYPTC